jgi:hypothetical protein
MGGGFGSRYGYYMRTFLCRFITAGAALAQSLIKCRKEVWEIISYLGAGLVYLEVTTGQKALREKYL